MQLAAGPYVAEFHIMTEEVTKSQHSKLWDIRQRNDLHSNAFMDK